MEIIKFDKILSVNNEIPSHEAKNLLQSDVSVSNSWLCAKGTEKAVVIIKLGKASVITKLDIGNAHSAFIEVQVGRASDSSDQYQTLIPTSTFMTPNESKASLNKNQVRFFTKDDFDQMAVGKRWDVLKVVCSQPFDKHVPFGLCFVKVHGEKSEESIPLKKLEEVNLAVGSFFKKRKEATQDSVKSITDRIKDAAKPEQLLKHTPLTAAQILTRPSTSIDKPKRSNDDNESDNRRNRDFGLDDDTSKKLGSDDEKMTKDKTPSKVEKRRRDEDEIEKKESERKKIKKDKSPKRCEDEDERNKQREKDKKRNKEIEEEREKRDEEKRKRRAKDKENERKAKDTSASKRKRKPFHRLLEDVVFVLSGYQNPERGTYRSHAIAMGARYKQDWEDGKCTHLVAAYINTPKCHQVRGKGKIVEKGWIEKCYNDKKRYPWRRFALDKNERRQPESEDEIDSESSSNSSKDKPSTSTSSHSSKPSNSSKTSYSETKHEDPERTIPTDDEDDASNFNLPDFFGGHMFYVDDNIAEKSDLERYIIAYNGDICSKLNEDVRYYITLQRGTVLEVLKKKLSKLIMVSPTWIQTINCLQRFVPANNFLAE